MPVSVRPGRTSVERAGDAEVDHLGLRRRCRAARSAASRRGGRARCGGHARARARSGRRARGPSRAAAERLPGSAASGSRPRRTRRRCTGGPRLAPVDHDRDVRVGELGDGARLATEALDMVRVGRVLLVQHLDGDLAAENPVAGAIDTGHAAPADELLELVPLLQDAPDHRPAG